MSRCDKHCAACDDRTKTEIVLPGRALTGTHHTTVFVNGGTQFNYAYFLVRRMGMLFHGLPSSLERGGDGAGNDGAILWGSGVGTLKATTEQACVQLLDE